MKSTSHRALRISVLATVLVSVAACGDSSSGGAAGAGGSGGQGSGATGGTGATGGMMAPDPDRFPWTFTVSLVQIDAKSSDGLGDINDWCDADNRGEFFAKYSIDPPGPNPAAELLDLDFDAGGPEDTRLYAETLLRTFTISSADEQARVVSGSSYEDDGFLGDDELSDFNFALTNIPPSVIDFTDVGCGPYGYESALGRDDCVGGCIIRLRNTAKSLCYLDSYWCYRNVSPPTR